MKRSFLTLAAVAAFVGASHAVVLVEDFESYTTVGDDMDGKGSWLVLNNSANVPVILDSYTWDGSNQSATIGGETPGAGTGTFLAHGVTVALDNTYPTYFEVELDYTESIGGDPRNDFNVLLLNGTDELFNIIYTPGAAGEYTVSWDSDYVTGGPVAFGNHIAGNPTQYRLDTWWDGSDIQFSFTNAGSPIATGVLTGMTATDTIDTFAVKWDTTNGVGSNSMTIDNVTLIPEPSSLALLGLGAIAGLRRRRNA